MCPCVDVFGFVVFLGDFVVDLWLIFDFCGWFLILTVGVCVSEEEADDDEGIGCADGEEKEKNERN